MMPKSSVEPTDRPANELPTNPRAWVDRYGDYLYRFALAKVRQQEAAEDLVQDTLLAAWQGRAEFAGRSSERTWLTAILKRKVIDWLRRQVRERLKLATEPLEDRFTDDQFTQRGKWRKNPGNWSRDDPASDLNRDEFWATLHDCLGKLPARLRELFVLRYLEETLTEETCEELGLTATNKWVILHRARLRMWWCLSVHWFGEEPQGGAQP